VCSSYDLFIGSGEKIVEKNKFIDIIMWVELKNMKFRIRRNNEGMLYVQYKTFLIWRSIKKDGEVILVHTGQDAQILAKNFYIHTKQKNKKDDILRVFTIS
jgi:hypothetical protein